MLIGDMNISRMMTYAQQLEEEKLKDKEDTAKRNPRIGMSLVNQKVVQFYHNFRKQRGMHH